jgi:cullin 2
VCVCFLFNQYFFLKSYLNTQYVKKSYSDADVEFGTPMIDTTEHLLDIGEMALECWRKFMIEPVKDKLTHLILDEIFKDRKGEPVKQSVLHGVINSLVDVADKRKKPLDVC